MATEEFISTEDEDDGTAKSDEFAESDMEVIESLEQNNEDEPQEGDMTNDKATVVNDAEYLSKLRRFSSPVLSNSFTKLKCLSRPWDHQEDSEVDTEPYFEVFCSALKIFHEDTLEDKAEEWIKTMESLMPSITCCIRRYVDTLSDDSDVDEFEERLADWVEFGLSLEIANRCVLNSVRHLHIGFLLSKRIFLMRRRQFAKKLAERHILHRLVDTIYSPELSVSQKCEALDSLFASVFHCSVTVPIIFDQVETDLSGETCYVRILKQLLEQIPVRISIKLHSFLEYACFASSLLVIYQLAKKASIKTINASDCDLLKKHVSRAEKYILANKTNGRRLSPYAYRSLYESEILMSLCVLSTASVCEQDVNCRCLHLLEMLVLFDGFDISSPHFLACCSTEVISLCLKVLSVARHSASVISPSSQSSWNVSALSYALHALQFLDELALANREDGTCIDSEKRISTLLDIFLLCSNPRSDGAKAVVAALSYSSNIEHLLQIFTFGQTACFGQHVSDDIKTNLRHSVCYGYACEILLTLARLQTDGAFWRQYGGIMCRLIDSNFISAVSSLKQWTEPLRDPLAQNTSFSSLYYLIQRLDSYLEKFKSTDDLPLSAITTLRLLDAVLKERDNQPATKSRGKTFTQHDLLTIFCEGNGLQKINSFLMLAVEKQSDREYDERVFLASDALIFETLLYSAISIVETIVSSTRHLCKFVDFSSVSVLLKVYSLFCIESPCRCPEMKFKILGIFSMYAMSELKSMAQKNWAELRVRFFEHFVEIGLGCPSNIAAFADILNNILTAGFLRTNMLSNVLNHFLKSPIPREWWSKMLLKFCKSLRFMISTGISSSRILRSSITSLCLRIICLGPELAKFVAVEVGHLCSRALLSMPLPLAVDPHGEGSDDEEQEVAKLGEIRFGAAADFTAAAAFVFLVQLLRDEIFRCAFIVNLAENPTFITGLLKFFNVASQKTVPHVYFQRQTIILFKSLCVASEPCNGSLLPMLPRDLFETLCVSLVDHLAQKEQSLDTAVLSLEALNSIGCTSRFGRLAVQEAVATRPDVLMRFACRIEAATDCPIDILRVALTFLASILNSVFSPDRNLFNILQWPPNGGDHGEGLCGEHPLLRLCELLKGRAELESQGHILNAFEGMLKLYEKPNVLQSERSCVSSEEWVPSGDLSEMFNASFEQMLEIRASDARFDDQLDSRLCSVDFDPPMTEIDLNAFTKEFLQDVDLKSTTQRGDVGIASLTNRGASQKRRLKRKKDN